jgi:hypothetical protein
MTTAGSEKPAKEADASIRKSVFSAVRGLSARVLFTLPTWAAAVIYAVIPCRPLFNSARGPSELDQAIWAREARSRKRGDRDILPFEDFLEEFEQDARDHRPHLVVVTI